MEKLTVAEVAKMAVTMEEKGREFYEWAAGQFQEDSIKQVFIRLAEEEKEHSRIFKKLMDLPEAGETTDPQKTRYIKMLAQAGDIFPHRSEIYDSVKTPVDALAYGIQAEKDAILLYQELYNGAVSEVVKSAISRLLEEEKMHLVELRESFDELKSGERA